MPVYISPGGKPEIHREKPDGYYTKEEWINMHPEVLKKVKAAKIAEIVDARNNAIDQEGAPYKGFHFYSDKGSKSDVLFALSAYEMIGHLEPFWKAMDGIFPINTPEDLIGIATAIGNHVAAQYAKEFQISAQINEAITVEQINAITW